MPHLTWSVYADHNNQTDDRPMGIQDPAVTPKAEVLGKAMDSVKPDPSRFEIGVVTREGKTVCQKILGDEEIGGLIAASGVFDEKKE